MKNNSEMYCMTMDLLYQIKFKRGRILGFRVNIFFNITFGLYHKGQQNKMIRNQKVQRHH